MNERSDLPLHMRLQTELATKARLLAELELQLADYHEERDRLIHDLRELKMQIAEIEEQLQDLSENPSEDQSAS
jgi:chromosome segregation ATPase